MHLLQLAMDIHADVGMASLFRQIWVYALPADLFSLQTWFVVK